MRLSGRLRSALIIGIQGIRARKTRTLLSMISLFLGVLAVVTVQAGADTAQRALLSNVELTMGIDGTRQAFVPPEEGVADAVLSTVEGRADSVALTYTTVIIGEPGVTPVNPGGMRFEDAARFSDYGPMGPMKGPAMVCDMNGCRPIEEVTPQPRGAAIELNVTAMTGDIRQFRPFRPESGEWFDFSQPPSFAPRLVLNKEAAKGFAMYQVPAEMRVPGAIQNPKPQIIGVVDDGMMEPRAYMRVDELANWMPAGDISGPYGGGLQVLMTADSEDVEQILRSKLAGLGLTGDAMHVETIHSREQAETTLLILRLVFLGMASLVLLIGVAGILNVGLATVGERVEEFALRRAVGTPRLLLAGIVLSETLLTGLFTAAAAIGFGAVAFQFVGPILGDREPILAELTFPWQAGVAGVIAGLVAGLLGGLIPAIRAARIPIASVMRA